MPRVAFITSNNPQIGVFSYGTQQPKAEASGQFEFDVTALRDPAGQKQFDGFNGAYTQVRDWVGVDRRVPIIIKDCLLLADDLIKPKPKEGDPIPKPISHWLSFSFKDHHGRWAAPAVAELVANALSEAGFIVAVAHRGISDKDLPKVEVPVVEPRVTE